MVPRRALRLLLLILAAGGVTGWLWPRDDGGSLPPAATAAALRRRVQAGYRFHCRSVKADATIPLAHADYLCEPIARPAAFGYWVSTDRDSITALQPTG